MEYVHRETGVFGEEARQMLVAFIKDKQDTHWKYVTDDNELESPLPVRSVVVKPSQQARRPKPRQETRPDSPMSLVEPEPILLEEPPRKKQRVEIATLLKDLACSPSLSLDDSVSEMEDESINEPENESTITETVYNEQLNSKEADKLFDKERNKTSNINFKGSEKSEKGKSNAKKSERNDSKTKTGDKRDKHGDMSKNTHYEKQDETKKDQRKVTETQNKNDKQIEKVTETQSDDRNKSETNRDKQTVTQTHNETDKRSGHVQETQFDKHNEGSKENKNVTPKKNTTVEQIENGKESQDKNEKQYNEETKSDKQKVTEKQCNTSKPSGTQNVMFESKERDENNDKDTDGQNVMDAHDKNEEHKKKDKNDKNIEKERKKDQQEKKETNVKKDNLKSKESKTDNLRGKDISSKKEDKMNTNIVENHKKKVTLKEYEVRREADKVIQEGCGSRILDDIMQDITNTYNSTQHQIESQPEFLETLSAVASITNDSVDQVVENACGVVSDCALELVEELVITEEIDNVIDRISEEIIEEKNLRKEQKSKRKAEKRKLEQNDANEPNEKRLSECGENTDVIETEKNNTGNDKDLENLKKIQGCKVVLNVGGARFETSILTLRKDSNSLLAKLFSEHSPIIPQGNSIFLDRDASHFKLILNYLRYDGDIMPAMLPREKRHLQELLKECEYYRIQGLYKIVKRRLKHLTELYGVDC